MLKALQLRFALISQAMESPDKINWGGEVFQGVVSFQAFTHKIFIESSH